MEGQAPLLLRTLWQMGLILMELSKHLWRNNNDIM